MLVVCWCYYRAGALPVVQRLLQQGVYRPLASARHQHAPNDEVDVVLAVAIQRWTLGQDDISPSTRTCVKPAFSA